MRTTALVLQLLLMTLIPVSSDAATIHHWRFENSPGFLEDSVGGLDLTLNGGVTQSAIPASGRGSEFDSVFSNDAAADFTGLGSLTTASFATTNFTVEVLAHPDWLGEFFGHTLVSMGTAAQNASIGWLFQIRPSGGTNQLTMVLCNGTSCDINFSGFTVDIGKDYYFASAVDLTGGETTLFFQNLTDGGALQSVVVANSFTTLNDASGFSIGSLDTALQFDGLIDEVKISDQLLSQNQLLIAPEPSTALLLGLGLVGLAAKQRRSN